MVEGGQYFQEYNEWRNPKDLEIIFASFPGLISEGKHEIHGPRSHIQVI